jgi:hypothetical protein
MSHDSGSSATLSTDPGGRSVKLLLVLASTVIFGSEPYGTRDYSRNLDTVLLLRKPSHTHTHTYIHTYLHEFIK